MLQKSYCDHNTAQPGKLFNYTATFSHIPQVNLKHTHTHTHKLTHMPSQYISPLLFKTTVGRRLVLVSALSFSCTPSLPLSPYRSKGPLWSRLFLKMACRQRKEGKPLTLLAACPQQTFQQTKWRLLNSQRVLANHGLLSSLNDARSGQPATLRMNQNFSLHGYTL